MNWNLASLISLVTFKGMLKTEVPIVCYQNLLITIFFLLFYKRACVNDTSLLLNLRDDFGKDVTDLKLYKLFDETRAKLSEMVRERSREDTPPRDMPVSVANEEGFVLV